MGVTVDPVFVTPLTIWGVPPDILPLLAPLIEPFQLTFNPDPLPDSGLVWHNGRIELRGGSALEGRIAIAIDWAQGAMGYRLRHEAGQRVPLIRAVSGHEGRPLRVVDMTAGLGRDGVLLAAAGHRVTLIERYRPLALLLADGVRRAAQIVELQPIVAQIEWVAAESRAWVEAATGIEVIYLDPMFPHRSKEARVKKELFLLQQLLGPCTLPEEQQLLTAARAAAELRVVVKRPKSAPPLAGEPADYVVPSKQFRYDVYRRWR